MKTVLGCLQVQQLVNMRAGYQESRKMPQEVGSTIVMNVESVLLRVQAWLNTGESTQGETIRMWRLWQDLHREFCHHHPLESPHWWETIWVWGIGHGLQSQFKPYQTPENPHRGVWGVWECLQQELQPPWTSQTPHRNRAILVEQVWQSFYYLLRRQRIHGDKNMQDPASGETWDSPGKGRPVGKCWGSCVLQIQWMWEECHSEEKPYQTSENPHRWETLSAWHTWESVHMNFILRSTSEEPCRGKKRPIIVTDVVHVRVGAHSSLNWSHPGALPDHRNRAGALMTTMHRLVLEDTESGWDEFSSTF